MLILHIFYIILYFAIVPKMHGIITSGSLSNPHSINLLCIAHPTLSTCISVYHVMVRLIFHMQTTVSMVIREIALTEHHTEHQRIRRMLQLIDLISNRTRLIV